MCINKLYSPVILRLWTFIRTDLSGFQSLLKWCMVSAQLLNKNCENWQKEWVGHTNGHTNGRTKRCKKTLVTMGLNSKIC